MAYNFVACDRDQHYLMPPSINEWLPKDHLARFILDVVDEMDLSAFYARHRDDGWGRAAFDPKMMTALLLYNYCIGERSSRKIERRCEEDIACRVITANQVPDHTTIARFRQAHEGALNGLFTQALTLCAEAGLIKAGVVALDGTKIAADASLAANRAADSIAKEVDKMLDDAAAIDAQEDNLFGEDRRGDELPAELADPTSRIARLKEAKARLDEEAKARQDAYDERVQERKAKEAKSGKKLQGRKPKPPDPEEQKKATANTTDPESRIMKSASGYLQGYNGQALVTEDQIVLAAELTHQANDVHQLHPMIDQATSNLDAAGIDDEIATVLADAGYWSEDNVTGGTDDTPELLIATTKDWKQRKAMRERGAPKGRIPGGLSERERMERKLLTKRGQALYKKRGQTVEPVFGQIKDGRGADRFMRRGHSACDSEWKLMNTTHNLLKLWRSGRHNLGSGSQAGAWTESGSHNMPPARRAALVRLLLRHLHPRLAI